MDKAIYLCEIFFFSLFLSPNNQQPFTKMYPPHPLAFIVSYKCVSTTATTNTAAGHHILNLKLKLISRKKLKLNTVFKFVGRLHEDL